jgi:thiol-disulfide isomerase/thioredoxin
MNRLCAFIALVIAFAFFAPPAQTTFAQEDKAQAKPEEHPHEYAPFTEKTINYKDWTYKSAAATDAPVNLRSLAQDKKLVMVVYFAPWCPNWHYEAPVAARLYDKYKTLGFEVVGISEYGTRKELKDFFGAAGAPYPVVVESESDKLRDQTDHYKYRQLAGDTRKWGSPFNVFFEPAKLSPNGDVITEKAWVVSGELIEADAEKFIREHLGLETTETKAKAITPCRP